MLLRLLNWVPVLFGLKFAGVASVATVPEAVASEQNAPTTTSERIDVQKSPKVEKSSRVTSGSSVTRLMSATSRSPVEIEQVSLTESFVFADIGALVQRDVESTSSEEGVVARKFVARPIAVAAPTPAERLSAVKAARQPDMRRAPGQVKQANRPKARADVKIAGKKVAKRVVWIASRKTTPAKTETNVIPFPTNASAAHLRRAA